MANTVRNGSGTTNFVLQTRARSYRSALPLADGRLEVGDAVAQLAGFGTLVIGELSRRAFRALLGSSLALELTTWAVQAVTRARTAASGVVLTFGAVVIARATGGTSPT